jgi:hypothetical protein
MQQRVIAGRARACAIYGIQRPAITRDPLLVALKGPSGALPQVRAWLSDLYCSTTKHAHIQRNHMQSNI